MASSWLRELRRRHVFRVAAAYAVVGWLLIQIATQVFPFFHIPDWSVRLLVLLVLAGFPVALVLAWAFDATPHGIVRAEPEGQPVLRRGPRGTLVVGAIGALVAIVVGTGYWWWHRGPVASAHATPKAAAAGRPSRTPAAAMHANAAGNLALPQTTAGLNSVEPKSIAVLPFVNMSGDPRNEYFSDGITEEILNALAQVPKLKVAARTSAFAFKGKEEDLRKVGEALGVATVLEGSVQRAGDEVRITAQLIDARSGYQLWSEKYDRKLTNIFAVEDEISKAITDKLQVQLAAGNGSIIAQKNVDPRAHDFYLRGLPLIAERGPGLRDAVADFQQAVAIDPDYAQAWAALAEAQMLLPHYFLELPDTAFPAGEAAARRALAIDPDTAAAYVALAMMYRVQWKWKQADAAFQRALRIAPGDAEAADQYGQFLLAEGRLHEALAQIDRAQRLDPLSGIIGATRTNVLTGLHRFDDAEAQAQSMIAGHPDYALGHFIAADVAIYRRDYSGAKGQLRTAAALVGENPGVYMSLVNGIADPAQREAARRAVLVAESDKYQRLSAPAKIKWLMLLGDYDDALKELQRVGHDVIFGQDNVWQPAFDPVRDDPRFRAALQRMGLSSTPGIANSS